MQNKRGQTALIMLFLFAVALIFFAISLNWSKIAQTKTQTLIAANTGATASASILASDAQSKWMQNLGGSMEDGRPQKCDSTSIWMAIVGVLIAVVALVLTIVTWGATWYLVVLAVAALVMAVTNLILQIVVIQPGLTALWNKMQRNLEPESYYMEQGIGTAISAVITDSANVPDLFDMDTDGVFYGGRGKAEVGRYGFFYTERLKMLQPPILDGVGEFISSLKAFTSGDESKSLDCSLAVNASAVCCQPEVNRPAYGCSWQLTDSPCTDPNDARCNSCCIPSYQEVINPFKGNWAMCRRYNLYGAACYQEKIYQLVRPNSCGSTTYSRYQTFNVEYTATRPANDTIPSVCSSDKNPYTTYTTLFPYVYGHYNQNYSNTNQSFLEVIGSDADLGGDSQGRVEYGKPQNAIPDNGMYVFGNPAIVRGAIFPLLWNMKDKLAITASANTLVDLSSGSLNKVVDVVTPITGMTALDAECPKNDTTQVSFTTNMTQWWKPMMDSMCSTAINNQSFPRTVKWPYTDSCDSVRVRSTGNGQEPVCSQWHDDLVDNIVKQGPELIVFQQQMSKLDPKEAEKNFTTWYPSAANWIAPKCADAAYCRNTAHQNEIQCSPQVCSTDSEGLIRQWRRTVGGFDGTTGLIKVFDDWLNKSFVQTTGAQPLCLPTTLSADMSNSEADLYDEETNGNFKTNAVNVARCLNYYKNADQKFEDCFNKCSRSTCTNLPRSLVSGFNPNAATHNLPAANQNGAIDQIYTELERLSPTSARAIELKTQLEIIYQGTVCQVGSEFLNKIKLSQDLALKNKALITQRANVIGDIANKAVVVRDEFRKAYKAMDGFLGQQGICDTFQGTSLDICTKSPAYKLMKIRRDFQNQGGDVNNFMIYAWQGPKAATIKNGTTGNKDRKYWHIVRVEVKIPERCPGNVCGANSVPWIRTETHKFLFLPIERCYILEDYNAKALVRVTRWDEDHDKGNIVSFMNKVKLWQFSYADPSKTPLTGNEIREMESVCGGDIINDKSPIGMTRGSWDVIRDNSLLNLPNTERDKFKSAFMINLLRGQVKNNANRAADCNIDTNYDGVVDENDTAACLSREKQCLSIVDKLLNTGVSSTACAMYYFRTDQQRMAVKFVNCADGDFKKGQTDYMDSGT